MNLSALHRHARRRLAEAGIDTPELDARLLVEHFSGTTRTQALVQPDLAVDDAVVAATEAALSRRCGGEPVHRILGFREFYGLRLRLSAGTLEPRPDTETLVDAILPFVRGCVAARGTCSILDLGTGTGAIALALLAQVPQATATGVDLSEDALGTARGNADALGLGERFTAVHSDWFDKISERYDVIVSNPPYIPADDILGLDRTVRDHDPARALDGGADGLDAYRHLAAGSQARLAPGGIVGVEIGIGQEQDVTALFVACGFAPEGVTADLSGIARALVFRGFPGVSRV